MNYLILDVVTSAAILFIISSGLLIIFGVMKIINFAHAGFLTVGGYASLVTTEMGWNPWLSFPIAFLMGCVFGIVVERLILRYLYDRPLDAILGTWGLSIIVGQVITVIFGREVQFAAGPLSGATNVLGAVYSQYRLWLIVLAVIVAITMWFLLQGTRIGLHTRAVIMNEQLARGLGIKSAQVRAITFVFGSGLACLAGAFIAPLSSVDPNLGISWLVGAFMLVLVSGDSLVGLAAACLVLGGAEVVASTYINPVIGGVTMPVLAALLLRIRPEGFAHG